MKVKDYKYDYRRTTFKIEEKGNQKKYYIKIKDEYIEVNKEIYAACKASYDKIRYTQKFEVAKSIMYYDDIDLATFFICNNNEHSIIDDILLKDFAKLILTEIEKLSEPDKSIAYLVFVEEKSISEVSRILNIPRTTITYKKKLIQKIIQEKIKKYLSI